MANLNRSHVLVTAALAMSVGNAGISHAEQAAAQDQSSDASHVEEIVVTAQKRSENIQRVPIAITALRKETVEALRITSTADFQNATPGLMMHQNGYAMTPSLRGISQSNSAAGDESPIAFYVDGVYYDSLSAGTFALNNIDRIEILKGPQGTLFGRNAAAGVVQIVTRQPQHTPDFEAKVGYGNYDAAEASFYGTDEVAPNVATDLAVYYRNQGDGWGKNPTTGAPTFTNHQFDVRNKWLIDLGDRTRVTVAADYENEKNPIGAAHRQYPGAHLAYAPPFTAGFYDLRENFPSYTIFRQWGASVRIDHDLGWARLVNIAAYRGGSPLSHTDQDTEAANLVDVVISAKSREATEEIQLLSPDSSRIKWIVGAFYLNNSVFSDLRQSGAAVPAPLTFVETDANLDTSSFSGFGQATLPLGDRTNITAGLRYTSDRQNITGSSFNNIAPVAGSAGNQSATFGKPTWHASIDHELLPDLMVYASYNRGFKSGVYNALAPTAPAVNPAVVDAYEAGVKSQMLDGKLRINGSFYHYDYNNIQLQVPVVGGVKLFNAAQARINGVDLDVDAAPVKGLILRGAVSYLDAKYTKFPNDPFAFAKPAGGYTIVPVDGSGDKMIYAPNWSANISAQYTVPTSVGVFDVDGSYYYNGGYFGDTANQLKQAPFNIIDASLGWTDNAAAWSVRIWGKNLNNKKYFGQETDNALEEVVTPAPPRTFGITLSRKWL